MMRPLDLRVLVPVLALGYLATATAKWPLPIMIALLGTALVLWPIAVFAPLLWGQKISYRTYIGTCQKFLGTGAATFFSLFVYPDGPVVAAMLSYVILYLLVLGAFTKVRPDFHRFDPWATASAYGVGGAMIDVPAGRLGWNFLAFSVFGFVVTHVVLAMVQQALDNEV